MRKLLFIISIFYIFDSSPVYARGTDEDRFIWNEANSVMFSANSKDDFLKAAMTYNKLIERGTINGAILYNLGTSLLLSGNYDLSVEALTRAERYSGTTWDIRRNLSLALAEGDSSMLQPLPWYRYPLFWHYLLPMSDRIFLAICAYSLFWLSLILRLTKFKTTASSIATVALSLLILFGSSAITSIYLESVSKPLIITASPQPDTVQTGGHE